MNFSCALMLTRYRHHAGSLTRAAFLSARNDALANVAIIGAGLTTIFVRSAWPDLIVGVGIALMNADAAREIYTTARRNTASPFPDFPLRPGNFSVAYDPRCQIELPA